MSEERPARPRRPLLWRLAPIAVAVAGVAIVGQLYGPHPVELLVRVPPEEQAATSLEVRITRENGKEVLRARREKNSPTGRTFVFDTKLPRGDFRLDAYPEPGPPLTATFHFGGEDAVEIDVLPR